MNIISFIFQCLKPPLVYFIIIAGLLLTIVGFILNKQNLENKILQNQNEITILSNENINKEKIIISLNEIIKNKDLSIVELQNEIKNINKNMSTYKKDTDKLVQ